MNLFWDNQAHTESALPTSHSQEMMLLAPILCTANDPSRRNNMPGERSLCFINLMEQSVFPGRHTV